MKTYTFTASMGYVGGSGAVKAKNKAEALEMANKAILAADSRSKPITLEDLTELKPNTCEIITNGQY